MRLEISHLDAPAVGSLPLEIVERKGVSPPDTICDALAEELSRSLSRYHLDHFGLILQHNVDKGLLCGGQAHARFGGGEVWQPIDIFWPGGRRKSLAASKCQWESLLLKAAGADYVKTCVLLM